MNVPSKLAAIARATPTAIARLRQEPSGHRAVAGTDRLNPARLLGDGLAILTLIVVVALITWDRLGDPKHLAKTDLISYFMPTYSYLGERLRAGDIPAWNPHQFSGAPFAGNPESGWMYFPVMLAFALLPTLSAMKAFVIIHVLLSALATYALGRVLGFRPIAALAAGAVYASGPVLAHTSCCVVFAEVEAWFPVTVLGAELAVRGALRAQAGGWLLAGLGLSQIMGAWLGQGTYYGLLILGSYLAFRTLIIPPHGPRTILARLRALALHGSVVQTLAFGLAAAGLLPRLEALGRSTLAGGDYSGTGKADPADVGYKPLDLAARLVTESGGGQYYFGGAILILAMASPWVARRRSTAIYFLALTAIPIVLVMTPTPLHTIFYALPRFELLQSHVPNRILVVAFFGAAVAAGATLDAVGRSRWRLVLLVPPIIGAAWVILLPTVRNERLGYSDATSLAAAFTVLILLASALGAHPVFWGQTRIGARVGQVLPVLLLVLMVWDPAVRTWGGGLGWAPANAAELLERHATPARNASEATAFLENQQLGEPFRFFGFDAALGRIGQGGCCDYHRQVLQPEGEAILIGNRSLTLGFQDIQGYDPVQDARYYAYLQLLNGRPQDYHEAGVMPGGMESPLLDLLNVRYIIVPARAPLEEEPELVKLIEELPTVYTDDKVRILANPEAMPRAWIVHLTRRVTREEALTTLADGTIDPMDRALLEIQGPRLEQAQDPAMDRVEVTAYLPDEIRLTTLTDAPGLLVLSEVYDPGWRAYVDGEEVELYRTNYLFRGVAVPAGAHDVELRYDPSSLRTGLFISSIAAFGAVGLALVAAGAGPALLGDWQTIKTQGRRGRATAEHWLRTSGVGRRWRWPSSPVPRGARGRRLPPWRHPSRKRLPDW
ncbi:MAG: YfhO family protein [Chloroflexia bacterium]|nr:YfhO family protein [Chloroflexia bacterium]